MIIAVAGMTILSAGFVSSVLLLYIMKKWLVYLESFIPTAKWLAPIKDRLQGAEYLSRYQRLTLLFLLFVMPGRFVRRGEVCARQIASIPRSLRWLVLSAYAMCAFSLLGALIFCVVT
jgi:hypothetical protein